MPMPPAESAPERPPARPGEPVAAQDSTPPLPAPLRWLLMVFAVLCLALGIIGMFVPLLPTVVFILMAAWAAARSSPRMMAWLDNHRAFGPMLRDWRHGGVVRRHAKWKATAVMAFSAGVILLTVRQRWAAALAIGCMATVLAWLWLRPEQPPPR